MTVIGVGLGQSNLRVASRDQTGQLTATAIPAAVWLAGPGDIRAGAAAAEASMAHPDQVITGVRDLLLRHEAAARAGQRAQPLGGPNGLTVSAHDAAARLFAAAASLRASQGGGPVTDVQLGVPELDGRSPALRRAAEAGGLPVRGEVAEPVAAALHYGAVADGADQLVVVFDLGGGTLDVTAMGIAGLSVEILDSASEPLGGDAWDTVLAGALLEQVPEPARRDHADSLRWALPQVAQDLRTQLGLAEQASRVLRYPDQEFELHLDQGRFTELTAGLLDQIMAVTQRAFGQAAERAGERPHTILLAGGASLMPTVQAALRARLDADIRIDEPELAVVSGLTVRPGLALLRVRVTAGGRGQSEWASRDHRPQNAAPIPKPPWAADPAGAEDPEPQPTAASPRPGAEHDPEPAPAEPAPPGRSSGEQAAEPNAGPDQLGIRPDEPRPEPDRPTAEPDRPSQPEPEGGAVRRAEPSMPVMAVPEGGVQADQVLSGQPVQQLHGIRRDDHLLLSWIWPEHSLAARVQWQADNDPAGPRGDARCSRRVYEHDGGFDIVIGSGAATVTVEALVPMVELDGPPSVLRVEAPAPVVRYEPAVRRGWRRRPVTMTFTSERDCQLPRVVVVHAVGRLRPAGPHQGTIVHEIPAQPLLARQPSQASFELPSLPPSSWLVCFPADPDAALIDLRPAALHRLKVS